MPKYAVKVLYLAEDDGWGESIAALRPQIMAGTPVLIWDASGFAGYICKSVQGDILDSNWLAQLLIAVGAELLSHEKGGNVSEN